MTTQVILNLEELTYQRAEQLARLTGKEITDVLADTLDISLRVLGQDEILRKMPVMDLNDSELLELADSQRDAAQDARFSELLEKQKTSSLDNTENTALLALMQVYQEGLFRKAQALNEAVKRGLRELLES